MLNEEQKQKVSAWIADGAKLADIQNRLAEECGVRLTYMDVRLLVDDLKLTPKDPVVEPPKPAEAPAPVEDASESGPVGEAPAELLPDAPAGSGKVSLTSDTIARPGTVVSGTVTFSDGKTATWYLDQTGRLGVVPAEQGYRPPSADVQEFQLLLDQQLQRMGF
jgi:hypothetical protein